MIVVKVKYRVSESYVNANNEMIQKFLTDFEKLDHTQFLYTIFQGEDNSFIHISQYKNKDIQQTVLNMPSFLQFQEQRDKNLVAEPEIEFLNFIGSSKEILK